MNYTFPIKGLSTQSIAINAHAALPAIRSAPTSRTFYAAAHVVADPYVSSAGEDSVSLDWDATMRFRHHLWSHGLGVAEAMDTAQRGMGMTWDRVKELLSRTMTEARSVGGSVVSGVATDQLSPGKHSLDAIVAAYLEQLEFTLDQGATPVIMCSRQLAASAQSAEDYLRVYDTVLQASSTPVVLHWLGSMFDPSLHGYWGAAEYEDAKAVVLELMVRHTARIDGIKMSLLNEQYEVDLRRQMPSPVKMYTGDDYNYVRLIQGDGEHHSHALLGAFAVVGAYAAHAARALDRGDVVEYYRILGPTEPLSREVFRRPTYYYKTGVVWLAYLSGFQDHFVMVGGLQSGRSLMELCELYILGNEIGLFPDPDLAHARLLEHLRIVGAEA